MDVSPTSSMFSSSRVLETVRLKTSRCSYIRNFVLSCIFEMVLENPCYEILISTYMGVSLNGGTPKSSILVGFSIINHPFWGTTIFGNTHIGPGEPPLFRDRNLHRQTKIGDRLGVPTKNMWIDHKTKTTSLYL